MINEEYYAQYKLLFQTEGWKQFKRDLEGTQKEVLSEFPQCKTVEELYFKKGMYSVLTAMSNFDVNMKFIEETITNDL